MENIHQQSKSLQKLTERNIKQIILQLYHGHWHLKIMHNLIWCLHVMLTIIIHKLLYCVKYKKKVMSTFD